jgi:predicted RNA-binding Zn ribbon-like protein
MLRSCCNGIVHLNPYGADAVLLAVNLATNGFTTPRELADRCVESGVESRLVRNRLVTAEDLSAVQVALDEWLSVVDAPDTDTRVERLNAMLAKYTDHPRLTNHADDGWHIHYRPDHVNVGRLVATLISTGTALHLAGRGMTRLGRCDATNCDRVYADLSRAGRQRYCSPACANRDAVRRHRSRAKV